VYIDCALPFLKVLQPEGSVCDIKTKVQQTTMGLEEDAPDFTSGDEELSYWRTTAKDL